MSQGHPLQVNKDRMDPAIIIMFKEELVIVVEVEVEVEGVGFIAGVEIVVVGEETRIDTIHIDSWNQDGFFFLF